MDQAFQYAGTHCSLDLTELGDPSLEEVGRILGIGPWAAREAEQKGAEQLRISLEDSELKEKT